MLSFRLAWRSFVRHKRRSIITASAIALSLAMMIAFVGLGDDGHARMAELGIRLGAGHVLVQGKGYQQMQTLDHRVPEPDRVVAAAKKIPSVRAVVQRVRASGLIVAGEVSAPVLVSGVDPTLEPDVSDIASPEKRQAGAYLRRRADMEYPNQPADIYLGAELAETLKVGLGDRVVLTVSPLDAERPTSAAFFVRGTFRTGLDEMDAGYAEIPIAEARQLLELGGQSTQVAVLLDELEDTEAATAALRGELAQYDELEVLSWQEALRELYEAIVLDDAGLYAMMAIIFVIVAIGIFNTVLMSVAERTREFGVMMAVGTSKGRLFRVIMAEAVILALVSAAFGIAIGLGIHSLVAHYGIDVTALAGGDYEIAGIAFGGKIYSRLTPWVVTKWTLVVIGIVLASAAYPATRASLLEPVEAMRHV
ncbi:MAG: ABC transporter permease [Deltaproteobacteria bacterium]|jgi:ABC-type lipoprotein release transport system permease subunit|nr:ABC transporter permease [Deltaproteobacteria bacterium]MBW2530517.1 ABC transporter permease [Deltaproteobacteria bacterium]